MVVSSLEDELLKQNNIVTGLEMGENDSGSVNQWRPVVFKYYIYDWTG
jgi:hypothetical protein